MKQAELQHLGFMMLWRVVSLALLLCGVLSCSPEEGVAGQSGAEELLTRALFPSGLVVDGPKIQLADNMDLSVTSSIFFRGKNASEMELDGQGFFLQMPRASSPFLQVAANKKVILKNVVLKDFSPQHLSFAPSASLVFGDNVHVQLADYAQSIPRSWVFDGVGAIIDGRGGSLQCAIPDAILINEAKEVTLKNIRLLGVVSSYAGHSIRCVGANSKLVLDGATVSVDSFFNFVQGNLWVKNDVAFKGLGTTFAWTSGATLTVDSFASLTFDFGTTFSYDAASKTRSNIVLTDVSSLLYFNHATLHATRVGLTLANGSMLFENVVTLKSEALFESEALVLDKSLQAFVPNGSTLDVKGKVVYQ